MKKDMLQSHSQPQIVHIVSHGPYCLDGVAAAVAVARYRAGTTLIPHFSGNEHINEVLRTIDPDSAPAGSELWITDISWTDQETDEHLRNLAAHGVKIFWFDHHRTAIKRYAAGNIDVPFTDHVISEEASAARLVYEHLEKQLTVSHQANQWFTDFRSVVAMADDNDRWIHAIPGSRELAWTIRAMGENRESLAGYHALLSIDATVTYTPEMRTAYEKTAKEIQNSFALAEKSRVDIPVKGTPYTMVAALCDGYPSEIGDAWGKQAAQTVFAFYDLKGEGVSLRRSPDCQLDLSQLAQFFGGGGHAAAAGCRPRNLHYLFAQELARLLSSGISALSTPDHSES
jgi:oligoribonuclease NrnB/cAMP/cGMP phosphodiesterase (DHH superfamily)